MYGTFEPSGQQTIKSYAAYQQYSALVKCDWFFDSALTKRSRSTYVLKNVVWYSWQVLVLNVRKWYSSDVIRVVRSVVCMLAVYMLSIAHLFFWILYRFSLDEVPCQTIRLWGWLLHMLCSFVISFNWHCLLLCLRFLISYSCICFVALVSFLWHYFQTFLLKGTEQGSTFLFGQTAISCQFSLWFFVSKIFRPKTACLIKSGVPHSCEFHPQHICTCSWRYSWFQRFRAVQSNLRTFFPNRYFQHTLDPYLFVTAYL